MKHVASSNYFDYEHTDSRGDTTLIYFIVYTEKTAILYSVVNYIN